MLRQPGQPAEDPTASPLQGLIGGSAAMRSVYATTRRVAVSNASVLLLGETGTGKELIAKAIHQLSPRGSGPFVRVNCGALSESLLESELFGHVRGSFTGAVANRAGRFEAAHTGTIFLDEINSTTPKLQVKLLRVLQEGEVDPVGARRSVKVDVRIISATNRDLARAVAEGVFREDLFYRLNVFPIEAPPLRERRQDIPALVEAFIRRFSIEEGRAIAGASAETLDLLVNYDWPGNIRQLENAVYRAIVLADSPQLQPYDFPAISGLSPPAPAAVAPSPPPAHLPPAAVPASTASAASAPVSLLDEEGHLRTLEAIEADLIRLAIERYQGHMSEVARRLGIGRSTLYRKVRENGLGDLVGLGDA